MDGDNDNMDFIFNMGVIVNDNDNVDVKVQGKVYNGLPHTLIYLKFAGVCNDFSISLPSKINKIKNFLREMRRQLNPEEGNGHYGRRKIKKAVVNTEIERIHRMLETLIREYNW